MALADVLAQLNFTGFSSSDEASIRSSITQLYNGSATARGVLDKTVSQNRTLEIKFVSGKLSARDPGTFQINVDLSFVSTLAYISPTGQSVQDQSSLIMHEIVHAIEGLLDEPRDTNTNSDGPTTRFTNQIRRELGLPERLSYEGAGPASIIPVGTNYTDGNEIDVALLSIGYQDTSSNSPGTRDLIIARDENKEKGPVNIMISGDGNDYLYSRSGNDILTGGGGDDFIDGGADEDIAIYSGACVHYSFTANADGTFTIRDTRAGSPDGTDTLRDVEVPEFTDGEVTLQKGKVACPGSNVILAIDVSGSMRDDLAAVKASANNIVEALFGTDDAPVASRLGIITFNDIGEIRTVLNFTDQDNIADRKAAALAGIASVNIIGGGEEPLNGALLSALRGDAGSWDEGATSNRIIVFSDEPAADPELRSQVLALAANTNVSLPTQTTTPPAPINPSFVDYTDEPLPDDSRPVPVQVLPILIGDDPEARDDFQALADGTGGQLFTAADASEVVDALIGAIETSINNPPTVANPIADQTTDEDAAFNFTIPGNTFEDVDAGDTLTLSVTLALGDPLPSWLNFDNTTNTLSGTPGNNDVSSFDIEVTATDSAGATVADTFTLTVEALRDQDNDGSGDPTLEGVFEVQGQVGVTTLQFTRQSSSSSTQVSEVGVFQVDDQNQVNGIAPGEAGFVQAALSQSQVIFSSLSDFSDFFINGISFDRQLQFGAGDRLVFYLIANSTNDAVSQGNSANVFFSLDSANSDGLNHVNISQTDGTFTFAWEETLGGSDTSFDDLIFTLEQVNNPLSLQQMVATRQGDSESELIDLTQFTGQSIQVQISILRSGAAFDNTVGFYRIENEQGTVRDPLTGQLLNPSDQGYVQAAVRMSQETGQGMSFDRNAEGITATF